MFVRLDESYFIPWLESFASPDDPKVGLGPGPNTTMYSRYSDVKEKLASLGVKLGQGNARRHNQIGALTIVSKEFFPDDDGYMVLGLPNEKHAFLRPWFVRLLGPVPGTAGIVRSLLKEELVKRQHKWNFWDTFAVIAKVFHKLVFKIDLSDLEAENYAALTFTQMVAIGVPPIFGQFKTTLETLDAVREFIKVLNGAFWEAPITNLIEDVTSDAFLNAKAKWHAKYRELLKIQFPEEKWTTRA